MKRLSTLLACAAVLYLMASPAHAITFDFSWSSPGGTTPSGSASGTFSVNVGAGDSFAFSDVTALDIAVSADTLPTTQFGLSDLFASSLFSGAIDAGGMVSFANVFIAITSTANFGCVLSGCSNGGIEYDVAGMGVGFEIWNYGSSAAALGSFMATAQSTALAEPGTLWMGLLGFSMIAWIRWSIPK